MSTAFTTLWTHDVCRELRRHRVGERPSVAFSGVHQSLPSWTSVGVGDDVFALHVNRCVVYLVSRLRVVDKQRRDCCGAAPTTWRDPSYPGHDAWAMLGANGCGASPVHVEATPIRFDVAVPGDLLSTLTWRNRRGEQRTLKYVVNGRLERSVSLQGVYRLTDESAAQLGALLDRSPTPSQRAEANHAHHGRQPSVTVDAR
ncbi:hypothetical protein MCAG_03397 [Micromonospora sp. ATCC 39149]|uniref:hypothetical protein n=1 Tax=Micromonospora sp. (strain ATCC 39149 / NRRL 15099 / SCC 1413) TaxID=219305 RepID=UPI0001A507EB|nr:hypothetical protein [Micromonospora sp. ATCC 39149]EEP73070.1 hypothetical protein MCAG_03397 [Micromonospora sp. ATCC 39149]